jgi:hypothetical protein
VNVCVCVPFQPRGKFNNSFRVLLCVRACVYVCVSVFVCVCECLCAGGGVYACVTLLV